MSQLKKVAIAQVSAKHLNLPGSLKILTETVKEAASKKVQLVVFGETWLSGYPVWLDHCPNIAEWDNEATKEAFLKLRQSSVEVPGKETALISKLAKEHQLSIVIGINEMVASGPGNGTIYNSLITFNQKGQLVNHHRKLMPTYTEKMLYGMGDGHGLKAADTSAGKVGGLICWEHWMPLARQTMHNMAEDIHVAVWPTVVERHQIASRHYAFEGRCFVLAAGQLINAADFPKELSLPDKLLKDKNQLVCNGGSCIINPRGEFIMEPIFDREELIVAEIDLDLRIKEQMTLDTTGHYQRPDVFAYSVNKNRL